MKGLNLSSFKKLKEDKDWATMIHKDGHTLMIAKAPLPSLHRKQLEALPLQHFDGGGEVIPVSLGNQSVPDSALSGNEIPDNPLPQEGSQPYGTPDPARDPAQAQVAQPVAPQAPAPVAVSGSASAPSPQLPFQSQIPGLKEEKAANLAGARALGEEGAAESKAIQDAQEQIAKLPTQADIIKANRAQSDQLYKAYQDKTLNPDIYFDRHANLAAGVGLILSGAGGGVNGVNAALAAIDKGIDRDIEAQRNAQEKSLNLWKMNREALGSDLAANLATQNQLYTGLKFKIDQAAAQSKGPIALANARAANAKIDQAIGLNSFKLSLLNPTSDNPDPASRVQFLVPSEHQSKVNEEISAAQNTVANAPGILQAFDQAAKEVRPLSGGVHTSGTAFIPGMHSPGQLALRARIGPTVQDAEGSVRESTFNNIDKTMTPSFGDDDSTIADKRASLIQYLRSKSAAPNAKTYGIDLTRYSKTNTTSIGHGAGPQYKISGGIKYMRGPNGEAIQVK